MKITPRIDIDICKKSCKKAHNICVCEKKERKNKIFYIHCENTFDKNNIRKDITDMILDGKHVIDTIQHIKRKYIENKPEELVLKKSLFGSTYSVVRS